MGESDKKIKKIIKNKKISNASDGVRVTRLVQKKIHQSASKSAPRGQGAASSEGVLAESRGKLQREGKTQKAPTIKAVPDVRTWDFFFLLVF